MRSRHIVRVTPIAAVLALLVLGGCAKTTVTQEQGYYGARLPRPARILVYDFAASASDLPAGYQVAVAAPPRRPVRG